MRIRIYLALLLLCCIACKHEEEEGIQFDKSKWISHEGPDYPYREQMLNDLIYNDTVRSLSKDEILVLLGEPNRRTDGYLYYTVTQRRIGFWPLHTRSLVINFADDSTIAWIKIHE